MFAETISKIYQPITSTTPLDWSTTLLLQGLLAGGAILYLSKRRHGDSFEIRDGVTLSGATSLAFLFMIDYLHLMKGMEATTYLGKKVVEVAGLTTFFAVLTVAWALWTYKWPGKYEVFQKITG